MEKYKKPVLEIIFFCPNDCLTGSLDNPIDDPGDWFATGN